MNQNPYFDRFPEGYKPIPIKDNPKEVNIFAKATERESVREDIYVASHNLADYLYKEKISEVIFFDNSARQAYLGLKEVWKKDYNKEPEPGIHFINPKSIAVQADFSELAKEFEERFKNVNFENPILLYDTCFHTGRSVFKIKQFFEYLGFSDVRVGITSVVHDFPEERKKELDLICLPNKAELGCNPFGKPTYIEDSNHLASNLKLDKPAMDLAGGKVIRDKRALALRKMEHQKIKDVFKED